MVKFEKTITGDFNEIITQLNKRILLDGISIKLVDKSDHKIDHTKVSIRVYDKYFARNSSRASQIVRVVSKCIEEIEEIRYEY